MTEEISGPGTGHKSNKKRQDRVMEIRSASPDKPSNIRLSGLRQSKNEKQVTPSVYQRGYELWRAGLSAAEIRNRLYISKPTWEWLLKVGCSTAPAYEDLLIDEVAAIRNSASQIAVELSVSSVKVLRDRMGNAAKANLLINTVLDRMMSGHIDEMDTKVLKALLPVANATSVADAFSRIYGASVAARALYPTMDHSKSVYVSPLDAIQGGEGDSITIMPAEQRDQVMADMSSWTPEQIERFATTGEEPSPSEERG